MSGARIGIQFQMLLPPSCSSFHVPATALDRLALDWDSNYISFLPIRPFLPPVTRLLLSCRVPQISDRRTDASASP